MACCSYESYTLDGCNLIFNNSAGHTVDIDLTQAEVRLVTDGKWVVQSLRSGTEAIHDDDALASSGSGDALTYALVRQFISSCKASGTAGSTDSLQGGSELIFSIASGETDSDVQNFAPYHGGSFYAPDEFNGDVITVYFDGSYNDPQELFSFTTTNNHYEPTDAEMLMLYSKANLYLVTDTAVLADAEIVMLVKA